MGKHKIYDCITFFDENILTNLRFEILKDVVDFFIICESKYDHKNRPKKKNFNLIDKKFKNKIKYILIEDPFPEKLSFWQIEEFQRERLLEALKEADMNDYIMYSDSDEIPNPQLLKNFNLKKKFGIFLQNFFVYNINTFNKFETPWEGTRICKKKNLKSITHLRKKIKGSNIKNFFRNILKPQSVELFTNGGWHFNNFYTPEKISLKLRTFQHTEYAADKYSNVEVIEKKVKNSLDLFGRNHKYKVLKNNDKIPEEVISLYNKIKNIS